MAETLPVIQIDDLVREMTQEEYEVFLAEQEVFQAREAERITKEEARTSALAKLAALGLTEEEISAL